MSTYWVVLFFFSKLLLKDNFPADESNWKAFTSQLLPEFLKGTGCRVAEKGGGVVMVPTFLGSFAFLEGPFHF